MFCVCSVPVPLVDVGLPLMTLVPIFSILGDEIVNTPFTVNASPVLFAEPPQVKPVYVPASIVCAAPLYSTVNVHVTPEGMAGLAVLCVCNVPVPLVEEGLPPKALVPIFNIRPVLMVNTPFTVMASAVLSPEPLHVNPVYVPASMVCVVPLYSTVNVHDSPVGIAGFPVFCVCSVPVPLVDEGLPLMALSPILSMRPELIVKMPLTEKASPVLSPDPLQVRFVYVPASTVCATPLYSTVKVHVSPLGIAPEEVFCVCKVPVPLIDVGFPLSTFVPILSTRPELMVNVPFTVMASAVLSPLPLMVKPVL